MRTVHNIDEQGRKEGCPYGQVCDRCNLYRPLYKSDSTGEVIEAVYDCNLNHQVMLTSEMKGRMLGVQRAVESRGNENIQRQDHLIDIFEQARNASLPRQ